MIRLTYLDCTPLLDKRIREQFMPAISAQRKEKADRLLRDCDKALSVGASLLLDDALGTVGLRERDMRYSFGQNGKPYFSDNVPFLFNLSHSENIALLSFSDRETGCDIEKIRSADMALAKKFFAIDEVNELIDAETERRDALFTKIWTKREAIIKYKGKSISDFVGRKVMTPDERITFYSYNDIPFYRLTLCTEYGVPKPVLTDRGQLIQKGEFV